MSYYQKINIILTDHAIFRAKQRIPILKNKSNIEIKIYIDKLIKGSHYSFESKTDEYIMLEKRIFAVFQKNNNIVKTITPISYEREYHISIK